MSFVSIATESQLKTRISEYYHEQLPLTCTLLVCDATNNIICGKLSFPFDQLTSMNVIKLKELVRSSSWLATRISSNNKTENNSINDANRENVRLAYYVINNSYNIQESDATFYEDENKKENDNYSNYVSKEQQEEYYNNQKKEEIEQSDTFFDNEANQNAIVNNTNHFNKSVIVNFPLKPLESNIEDWHELCQDIIIHGCKSIRLVVAYSTEQQEQQQRVVNERESSDLRKVENTNATSDSAHCIINNNDDINELTLNQLEPICQSLLMVRCNINPTEIHITGNVETNTLEALRRAIFTKCPVCHSYLQAIQGVISETTDKCTSDKMYEVNDITLWQYLPAFEQVDHKRSKSKDTERSYVIKLHCFHFTKADEEVLQKCINEVLTRCEECTPVQVETTKL